MPRETEFEREFIKRLEVLFPGCYVIKGMSAFRQGIPDRLLLWRKNWAALEFKRREPRSSRDFETNQEWYLEDLGRHSFSACVYPENAEEVLNALQRSFLP